MRISLLLCSIFIFSMLSAMEPIQPEMGQKITEEILKQSCLEKCEDCSNMGCFTTAAGIVAFTSARGLHRYINTPTYSMNAIDIGVSVGGGIGLGVWAGINHVLCVANEPRKVRRAQYLAQLANDKAQ